jgi:hypothetical protein
VGDEGEEEAAEEDRVVGEAIDEEVDEAEMEAREGEGEDDDGVGEGDEEEEVPTWIADAG